MTKFYVVYTASDKSEGVLFANYHDALLAAGQRGPDGMESTLADNLWDTFTDQGDEPLEIEEVEITQ